MLNWVCKPARYLQSFGEDNEGSGTTEWVVAVAIVMLMAVPVMAVIGEGSGSASEDIVVSIEDADSFGGGDFHGDDGNALALDTDDEDSYRPGEDLGIGYPDKSAQDDRDQSSTSRPRLQASAGSFSRRDKPLLPRVGGVRPTGDVTVQSSKSGGSDIVLPRVASRRVSLSSTHCIDEGEADAAQSEGKAEAESSVIASGR